MILQLKKQHIVALQEETQRYFPIEACGLLFGDFSEKHMIVQKIVFTPNKLDSTSRFEIDPSIAIKTILKAESEGLELIGIFHSHQAPAVPSDIDLKFMRLWGNVIWLILSSTEDTLGAFQLQNGKIRGVDIEVRR